jgi:hypothetical protein
MLCSIAMLASTRIFPILESMLGQPVFLSFVIQPFIEHQADSQANQWQTYSDDQIDSQAI